MERSDEPTQSHRRQPRSRPDLRKIRSESLALQGGEEADNWESFHARSHGWILHAVIPYIYVTEK